jgi:hypothetical protein
LKIAPHLSTDKAAPFSKSAAKVRKNVKTTKLLTIKSEILHHQHSYAAPSVLLRYTVSTLTLHRQKKNGIPSIEKRNSIITVKTSLRFKQNEPAFW